MLRDHAKSMLEAIADDLAQPETAHQQSEKSKGHGLHIEESAASTHGSNRVGSGFSLNATVSEYRALRAANIPAALHVTEAGPHTGFPGGPEGAQIDQEIRLFIKAVLQETMS